MRQTPAQAGARSRRPSHSRNASTCRALDGVITESYAMTPETLQTVSQVFIVVGVVIAGLGGFGAYYYGNRVSDAKDRASEEQSARLNSKIDSLAGDNQRILEKLEPFLELARKQSPGESDDEALDALLRRIQGIKANQQRIEQNLKRKAAGVFDIFPEPNESGGIRVYSRKAAIQKHYAVALGHVEAGRWQDAKTELELILEKAPDHVPSLNLLGTTLHQLDESDAGIKLLERAFQLSGDDRIRQNIDTIRNNPGARLRFRKFDL
jgi:tetratricopeptide (TPR) repeat protein